MLVVQSLIQTYIFCTYIVHHANCSLLSFLSLSIGHDIRVINARRFDL